MDLLLPYTQLQNYIPRKENFFFLMVGRGGGGETMYSIMRKGGIFTLVANNAMVGVGGNVL